MRLGDQNAIPTLSRRVINTPFSTHMELQIHNSFHTSAPLAPPSTASDNVASENHFTMGQPLVLVDIRADATGGADEPLWPVWRMLPASSGEPRREESLEESLPYPSGDDRDGTLGERTRRGEGEAPRKRPGAMEDFFGDGQAPATDGSKCDRCSGGAWHLKIKFMHH